MSTQSLQAPLVSSLTVGTLKSYPGNRIDFASPHGVFVNNVHVTRELTSQDGTATVSAVSGTVNVTGSLVAPAIVSETISSGPNTELTLKSGAVSLKLSDISSSLSNPVGSATPNDPFRVKGPQGTVFQVNADSSAVIAQATLQPGSASVYRDGSDTKVSTLKSTVAAQFGDYIGSMNYFVNLLANPVPITRLQGDMSLATIVSDLSRRLALIEQSMQLSSGSLAVEGLAQSPVQDDDCDTFFGHQLKSLVYMAQQLSSLDVASASTLIEFDKILTQFLNTYAYLVMDGNMQPDSAVIALEVAAALLTASTIIPGAESYLTQIKNTALGIIDDGLTDPMFQDSLTNYLYSACYLNDDTAFEACKTYRDALPADLFQAYSFELVKYDGMLGKVYKSKFFGVPPKEMTAFALTQQVLLDSFPNTDLAADIYEMTKRVYIMYDQEIRAELPAVLTLGGLMIMGAVVSHQFTNMSTHVKSLLPVRIATQLFDTIFNTTRDLSNSQLGIVGYVQTALGLVNLDDNLVTRIHGLLDIYFKNGIQIDSNSLHADYVMALIPAPELYVNRPPPFSKSSFDQTAGIVRQLPQPSQKALENISIISINNL